ncbi:MAG: hypothetical protein Kow0092_19030 [Deferrisomatales bacterium]
MPPRSDPSPTVSGLLDPLLPQGTPLSELLPPSAADALERHLDRLAGLGFELTLTVDSLRVRHRLRGFETVIRLSLPDDMGERRRLFRALRRAFGSPWDRWAPWALQPPPAVTLPYESLKAVLQACQSLRQRRRSAETRKAGLLS